MHPVPGHLGPCRPGHGAGIAFWINWEAVEGFLHSCLTPFMSQADPLGFQVENTLNQAIGGQSVITAAQTGAETRVPQSEDSEIPSGHLSVKSGATTRLNDITLWGAVKVPPFSWPTPSLWVMDRPTDGLPGPWA